MQRIYYSTSLLVEESLQNITITNIGNFPANVKIQDDYVGNSLEIALLIYLLLLMYSKKFFLKMMCFMSDEKMDPIVYLKVRCNHATNSYKLSISYSLR